MKSILIILLISLLSIPTLSAQVNAIPVKEWKAAASSPFVLYISGDGGFNSFSELLCTALNKAGYNTVALNAKAYFWNKKTPEQSARDFSAYLDQQFKNRLNQQLVLAGYSFGADVVPFIVNKLPGRIKDKLISVVMLAPSTSTDFEVHLMDLLGANKKRSMDVIAEMNRMVIKRTTTIFGNGESSFPVKDIRLRNYTNIILPGGHHFDGNTTELAKVMVQYF